MAPAKLSRTAGTPDQSPSSYYLLLAVKILLVLIILFMLPHFVTGDGNRRRRSQLKLRRIRWDCQNDSGCALLIPEESLDCVNQCVSPACYNKVYADMPLEHGEIDVPRALVFDMCVQEELRVLRRQLGRRQTSK